MAASVLTINGGSSTIKFALYAAGQSPNHLLSGSVDRIGLPGASLSAKRDGDREMVRLEIAAEDHHRAVDELIRWLDGRVGLATVSAIGHRIVHGGPRYFEPTRITDEVVDELRRLSPLDPAHLPGEIALIDAFTRCCPELPQFALFDTAFHHDMPRHAALLPLPLKFEKAGMRRYGFHGISYAYLMEELARLDPVRAKGRVILAHLGSGASMAAVHDGKCIDTSMSFTPTAGLVMGTRCGDLDPGAVIHLLRSEGLTVDQVDDLLNRRSGLRGLSEVSPDLRDLLERQASDPRAADAIAVYCYQAKKYVGAYAAALGGLDTLVFSAGVGENAAEVRARICEGLGFLGIELDVARNAQNAAVISSDASATVVRVIPTDEALMIARQVFLLLRQSA